MNPKFQYVLNYFRQIYKVPQAIDIGYGTTAHRINIHACQSNFFDTFDPFPEDLLCRKTWKHENIPFLFSRSSELPVWELKDGKAFIHDDLLAAAFFFLSGWQEYVFMKKYLAPRYPYAESLQRKLKLTPLPIVNYYFDILRNAIEQVYNISLRIRAWDEHPFALCLTHDIDKCFSGWKQDTFHEFKHRRIASALSIIGKRALGRDPWFNFEDILALEKHFEARSTFFFLARRGKVYQHRQYGRFEARNHYPRRKHEDIELAKFFSDSSLARLRGYDGILKNADYDITHPVLRQIFQKIYQAGSEIGIHGSFGSHLDAEMLQSEISRFPRPVVGNRFHFLNFDITRSFEILEGLQLKYDSTLGFAEETGFRSGIAFPFVPYNITHDRPGKLLEIPLMVMDTTFRTYKGVPAEEGIRNVRALMAEVEKFNGCLTLLWHNAYFSPYKFKEWRETYAKILSEGENRNALLLSAEEVYQRWKELLD